MFFKSFQFKLFSSFILFGLILSAITLYIFIKVIEEGYLSQKTDLFYDKIVEKENYINSFQNKIRSKIEILSNNYNLDVNKKTSFSEYKEFLNTVLLMDDSVSRISFFDNEFNELINIYRQDIGIENIKDSYYFDKINNLKSNQIFISDFFYDDKLAIPYYKIVKKLEKGYLIFDINLGNSIFSILQTTYKENWYIVDQYGRFIIHKDEKYNWSKYNESDFNIKDEFPNDYKDIMSEPVYFNDQLMSRKISLSNGQEIVLILSYTEDFAQDLKNDYLALFKIIVLVTIIISILLGFILSKPFIKINKRINSLNMDLDNKVKQRTEELSSSLKLIDKYIITSKTDIYGNITSVSEAFCNISGYKKEELIGESHNIVRNTQTGDEVFKDMWEKISTGASWSGEVINKNKDNETYHIYSNIEPIFKGNKKIGYMAVAKDITDKKNLEKLNIELEERIKEEVEKNIEQNKKHVEDRIKNVQLSSIGELAAGITHEINTPLTFIKGNVEMMKYDVEDIENEKLKANFEDDLVKIDNGIKRIESIIDTMREVSQSNQEGKYEANVYETLIIALTMINNRAKQISKIYINNEQFEIGAQKDKLIIKSFIQKQRVEQLWIVILNNALDILSNVEDYEDRKVEIFIENKENKIYVKFIDNGGGIKEDILDNIFDPLVGTKKHGGLGVGLNIAKKIVDDQEGQIRAYNKDGCAIFEVVLDEYR